MTFYDEWKEKINPFLAADNGEFFYGIDDDDIAMEAGSCKFNM